MLFLTVRHISCNVLVMTESSRPIQKVVFPENFSDQQRRNSGVAMDLAYIANEVFDDLHDIRQVIDSGKFDFHHLEELDKRHCRFNSFVRTTNFLMPLEISFEAANAKATEQSPVSTT